MNSQASIVKTILADRNAHPRNDRGVAFAPANIALCKYWGKRDTVLNLPVTNSLSLSMGQYGATTEIACINQPLDQISLNGVLLEDNLPFVKRIRSFLDCLRMTDNRHAQSTPITTDTRFSVKTQMNLPVGAGLASSSCGFAALVKALDALFGWQLPLKALSILARLGSGSACRSLWTGFVEWEKGERSDGMDSYGVALPEEWPGLKMGLWILDPNEKPLSSREAMLRTVGTSPFYSGWPSLVEGDLKALKSAIALKDFEQLGATLEANACSLHGLMMSARPPILYSTDRTLKAIHQIWEARKQGLSVYFTQDAGPNLKLFFLDSSQAKIEEYFPDIHIISPWEV